MEELLRLLAEAYRTGARSPFPGIPPLGAPFPGAPPGPAPGAPPHAASPPPCGYPFGAPGWPPSAPGLPPLPSLFDFIRLQAMIYEESLRIRDLLLDRLVAPAFRGAP